MRGVWGEGPEADAFEACAVFEGPQPVSEAAGGVGVGAGDPVFNQSFVDERAIAQVEVRGGGGAVAGAGERDDDIDGLGDEMFVEPLFEGGGLIGERSDAGEADGGRLGLAGVGDEQLFISEDVGDGAAGGGGGTVTSRY